MLVIAAVCLGAVVFLSGCGNDQADTSAMMPSPSSTEAPKVAASGPAVSTPLEFSQLALESAVTKYKNKQGLSFLRFSYADRDGKIYKCELPEAMSTGSYTIDEWNRTFNCYRLPEVIGQKKVARKGKPGEIGDFPFISPKPRVEQQQPGAQQPQAEPMPDMPRPPLPSPMPMPTSSPGPNMMPPPPMPAD